MADETRTLTEAELDFGAPPADEAPAPALVIVWSAAEPERVGEVAFVPGSRVLGRGEARPDDDAPRLQFVRQRPGEGVVQPGLGGRGVSRRQLRVEPSGAGLRVTNVGRSALIVDGAEVASAEVRPGQIVGLRNQLLLLCEMRPRRLPALRAWPANATPAFGAADRFGMVGESPAAWALRDRLAFHAGHAAHVLVSGPSGSGKELAARALHGLSPRDRRALVARNAATLPEGLVDAELFGNVKDYPNPGMPARPGLCGEADGGTLFLDEIGELPEALQAHLLRVLDAGEYTRLGEARARRADLRLIAATNRAPEALKHDLGARLKLRIELPGLGTRRSDVPMLVYALLDAVGAQDAGLRARFWGAAGRPRVAPELMARLVRHDYRLHVRELDALLWRALGESPGDFLALTPGVVAQTEVAAAPAARLDPAELSVDQIRAALEAHAGNQSAAWKALGLRSRHQLVRLIKKHGL